jgi:hypothetical protein
MRINDRDYLLRRVLEGPELERFRQSSLEFGLAYVRIRQRRRRLGQTYALVSLLLFTGFAVLNLAFWPSRQASDRVFLKKEAIVSCPENNPNLKVITDEELFALFPGRSMALVGHPGHQQLVFLDGLAPVSALLVR